VHRPAARLSRARRQTIAGIVETAPPAPERSFPFLTAAISSHLTAIGDLVDEGRMDEARAVLRMAVAIRGEIYLDRVKGS
jgi:hypothetical protein